MDIVVQREICHAKIRTGINLMGQIGQRLLTATIDIVWSTAKFSGFFFNWPPPSARLICGMSSVYSHHASVQQNYRKINCELIIAQNNSVTYLTDWNNTFIVVHLTSWFKPKIPPCFPKQWKTNESSSNLTAGQGNWRLDAVTTVYQSCTGHRTPFFPKQRQNTR